jgi:hypothetical protein
VGQGSAGCCGVNLPAPVEAPVLVQAPRVNIDSVAIATAIARILQCMQASIKKIKTKTCDPRGDGQFPAATSRNDDGSAL